jgi:hypothetical protein
MPSHPFSDAWWCGSRPAVVAAMHESFGLSLGADVEKARGDAHMRACRGRGERLASGSRVSRQQQVPSIGLELGRAADGRCGCPLRPRDRPVGNAGMATRSRSSTRSTAGAGAAALRTVDFPARSRPVMSTNKSRGIVRAPTERAAEKRPTRSGTTQVAGSMEADLRCRQLRGSGPCRRLPCIAGLAGFAALGRTRRARPLGLTHRACRYRAGCVCWSIEDDGIVFEAKRERQHRPPTVEHR